MRTFPKRSPLRLGARAKEPVGAIRVPGLVAPTRPSQPALDVDASTRAVRGRHLAPDDAVVVQVEPAVAE